MVELGAVKESISLGADLIMCVWGGPKYCEKTLGGTNYQVGRYKSPASRMEVVSLCIVRLTLSLMEHKLR